VTERDVIGFWAPLLGKEHSEVMGFGVDDVAQESADEFLEAAAQRAILPGAQQTCVGFQKVEMGVHGFLFVHVHVAQPLLPSQRPVTLEGFKVSPVQRIVTGGFDRFIKTDRLPQ
jgi:hypothetical protein